MAELNCTDIKETEGFKTMLGGPIATLHTRHQVSPFAHPFNQCGSFTYPI